MDKKQREERRRQEDIALQRALLWVAAAVVLEGLLALVNRFYINYYVDEVDVAILLDQMLKAVRIGALLVGVAAFVWGAVQLWKGRKAGLQFVAALAGGALTICAHIILKYQDSGMPMLFWLVIAWAVLALVYYIYQKEFFLAASGVGLSVLGLWFVRYGQKAVFECVLIVAAIVAVVAAVLWLKKSDGVLPGKEPVRFLPKGTSYVVTLVSCLAGLAVMVAALILGGTAAYYLIFVMLVWLFALFVYYTVKLM